MKTPHKKAMDRKSVPALPKNLTPLHVPQIKRPTSRPTAAYNRFSKNK